MKPRSRSRRGQHALDRRVRDVALVPERHVLEGGRHGRAHDAGQAAEVLAQDRVALVGHRARALLADRERLFGLAHLAPLPVPHVGREPLDARRHERERGEVGRVPVARDDLRGTVSASRPSAASARFSMAGDRCAYVPTAPAILPTAISLAPRRGARAARDLGVVSREREAERDRLGEDPVAPSDHRRLRRARARASASAARSLSQRASSLSAASRSRIASDVSSTSLEVMPRWSQRASMPAELLDVREEGDDVVLGRALDLVDAGGVEDELLGADAGGGAGGDEARLLHRLTGGELDVEPDGKAAGGRPEISDVGGGVAGDHAGRLPQVALGFMPAARRGLLEGLADARPVRGGSRPPVHRKRGAADVAGVVAQEERDDPGRRRERDPARRVDLRHRRTIRGRVQRAREDRR